MALSIAGHNCASQQKRPAHVRFGHDRSFGDVGSMSALAHFADSSRTCREVREVPKPAVSRSSNMPCAEGRVIPAAGTSDYCGSLCSGRPVEVHGVGDKRKIYWTIPQEKTIR